MSLTLFVNDLTNITDVAKQILEYTLPIRNLHFMLIWELERLH